MNKKIITYYIIGILLSMYGIYIYLISISDSKVPTPIINITNFIAFWIIIYTFYEKIVEIEKYEVKKVERNKFYKKFDAQNAKIHKKKKEFVKKSKVKMAINSLFITIIAYILATAYENDNYISMLGNGISLIAFAVYFFKYGNILRDKNKVNKKITYKNEDLSYWNTFTSILSRMKRRIITTLIIILLLIKMFSQKLINILVESEKNKV